jgi:hypothetical protein
MTNNGGDWETARNHCLTNGAGREIRRYETLRDKPSSLLTWTRARCERGMRSVVNSFTFPLVRGDLNPAPLDPEKRLDPHSGEKVAVLRHREGIQRIQCMRFPKDHHRSVTPILGLS